MNFLHGDLPLTSAEYIPQKYTCTRAVMLAIAQIHIQDVYSRDVEKVMAEFGLESLSSSQVSRVAALLNAELEAWRTRPLGTFPDLSLDARCEKVRIHGVVRDAAILSPIGIDEQWIANDRAYITITSRDA